MDLDWLESLLLFGNNNFDYCFLRLTILLIKTRGYQMLQKYLNIQRQELRGCVCLTL
jgi:hypothetical protein